MIQRVYISGQRIDLFEDENIQIDSSIADASDLKKTTTDFSKEFTVPASSSNNKFFKHYYNANINNTFDARVKQDGFIELSGVPFRFGKFRLLKVNLKKNKPDSYTVNFVGNLVDIKKKLGKAELSSLDLSEYDHDFDGDTVKLGLTSELFGGDLIYTLNPKRQYFYNSDINDVTNIDTLTNIADNGSAQVHGVQFAELSPSIKAIRILDQIEDQYNLTFSRDFFGTTEFSNLYQTLSNKKDSISGGSQIVDFDGGDTENISLISDTGTFTSQASPASNDNVFWRLFMNIFPSAGYENVPYTLTIIIDGQDDDSDTATGDETFIKRLSSSGERTFEVRYRIQANEEFKYTARLNQNRYSTVSGEPPLTPFVTTASENTLQSIFVVADNIPKIKIIDWLVGFFKAFKLVTIPQQDGSFYVDTLNRYYAKGTIYDVTDYIDFEGSEVSRGTLFNEILFNFEPPELILNKEFKKNTGIAYGDEEVRLTDENGEPLDGDSYEIKVPFETVVYDRLQNVENNVRTTIMYAPFVDDTISGSFPKVNLFYNIPQSVSSYPIRFINNNQVIESISTNINTAFHTDQPDNENYSFLFGEEFNEWSGARTNNNLYSIHHKRYIDSIFNIRRRNYKFKAVLPLWLRTTLALNDVLKIKGDFYRIDKYTTNLNNVESTFNLINVTDSNLNEVATGRDSISFNALENKETILLTTGNVSNTIIDTGYGTSWITLSEDSTNLEVTAAQNNTGSDRTAFISIEDSDKLKQDKSIYIFQSSD